MERFAKYTFAPWPDEELLSQAATFRRPYITRFEQRFNAQPSLQIEIEDGEYSATGETGYSVDESGQKHHDPNGVPGVLRFVWEGFQDRIFALESYDEFYSAPYAQAYAWKKDSPRRFLHEIISEPDAWIREIVDGQSIYGRVSAVWPACHGARRDAGAESFVA